ncbi:2OG-Fe(II) oxygenase superfamily-domain-containing protein [Fimicolochytrium jonesii]|uniref:2OG-Fe(II) oxygenase superfamily-domain-containing protein n=1 Tax=Fimicolochytrium jonesii TaxID=1396493 RepID=UPI0022FDB25F|nr:2OG-Fe(II) oxygenase superfamily-domain-containing protein [Fimicolochytrium jonesii]KAI8817682.1 2OG-Fe(II) oxygenase superfamily-domain-containing protein [Fimicolochytrium jonesii]
MGKKKPFTPPPDSPAWPNQTAFRVAERTWKRRDLPPELLASIIDPGGNPSPAVQANRLVPITLAYNPPTLSNLFGPSPETDSNGRATAYSAPEIPGLILIPGLITPEGQVQVVKASLKDYTALPNVTNLDTHWDIPSRGLWHMYEQSLHSEERQKDEALIPMRHDGTVEGAKSAAAAFRVGKVANGSSDKDGENALKSKTTSTSGIEVPDTTSTQIIIDLPTTDTQNLKAITASEALKRLRWTSLGFQYNWSTKEYHLDRRPPFPPLIDELATQVVKSVENITGYNAERWISEAGIINFYQERDALMAHQDRSEINTEAPLISFSFGNSSVFLIGSENRDDTPIPILLRSGDVLVMHGNSRRAYHALPRILGGTCPDYLTPESVNDAQWRAFYNYLKDARINVNVRQVY